MARINGTRRDDSLDGTPLSDIIIARQGNDRVSANGGNDVINGSGGRDTLTGGSGRDKFVLSTGPDVITDFTNGQDLIVLPGRVSFNRLRISAGTGVNAGDTVISIGRQPLMILEGVRSNQIDRSDFTNDLTPIIEGTEPDNGFNIEFDYRFDSMGFFDDPARRAALETAGDIFEDLIQDEFDNIQVGIEVTVKNPSTGEFEAIVLEEEIDDLLIFVGAQSPPFGGEEGAGASANVSGNAAGSIFSNRFNGSNFEPWVGSISFLPSLGDEFFIPLTLHEIGHILGIGLAPIFSKTIGEGDGFEGPNAMAVNGGNSIPLESIEFEDRLIHVRAGFVSAEGDSSIMISPLETDRPSRVDLAMLADIGYEIEGFEAQGETPPIATEGDDVIVGTILDDLINGLGGNDNIFGELGDDTINGDAGNDTINGNLGNNLINGGNGNDELFGDVDNDTLNGDAGNDFLQGWFGNDLLNGGAGNDNIFGELGDDTINGDSGDDTINGNLGDNFVNGGSGDDDLFGGDDSDTLNGDAGNDELQGWIGNDLVNGGNGTDSLFGYVGNDTLNGDAGNDELSAWEGNDLLNGGTGSDIIWGGAGRDTFFFGANNGEDTINDFEVANEVIQIASGLGFTRVADVLATVERTFSNTSVFTLSPGNTITVFHEEVFDLSITPLTAANFVIV